MAGSLNKVMLIGNLGSDPEVRSMNSGDEVASFSVATSESWKDKATGERKDRTQWHKVVIFNSALVNVARNYLHKGSKVFIEGQLETRKWQDKETGREQYTTEVVLRPYRGELTMLDAKGSGGSAANDTYGGGDAPGYSSGPSSSSYGNAAPAVDELADDIPF